VKLCTGLNYCPGSSHLLKKKKKISQNNKQLPPIETTGFLYFVRRIVF